MRFASGDKQALTVGLLAGLCGGAAEVLWVTVYTGAIGMSGAAVAQQVAVSVIPAAAGWPAAPLLGIAVHTLLSMALGLAFAWTIRRIISPRLGAAGIVAIAVTVLTLVWAVNFFLVLPVLNPTFVKLLPSGATFFSKLLFGLAMASVLQCMPLTLPQVARQEHRC